jgi:endonuclease-8
MKESPNYSFDFLEWKKKFVLKKHWLAHTKKTCQRCNLPLTKNIVAKQNEEVFFAKTAR